MLDFKVLFSLLLCVQNPSDSNLEMEEEDE